MKKIVQVLTENKKLLVVFVSALVSVAGIKYLPSELVDPIVSLGLEIASALTQ